MLLHASVVYFFLLLRNKSTVWMYCGLSVYLLIDLACFPRDPCLFICLILAREPRDTCLLI